MNQSTFIERARRILPGGGFGNFDPGIIISNGKGARVWDEDGNEYVDYLIGSGPMILGHGHPEVLEAIAQQLGKGMTFFANNARGIELAEEICRAVNCAKQVRYVSTGGEADMYAMRLARAYTGRDLIVKFEGGYHGMSAEAQMSLAPKELKDFPAAVPDSAGIPEAVRAGVLIAPYNNIDFFCALADQHEGQIAAVIVEPMQRIILPAPGFLQGLRDECSRRGIVLIFDEVVTGFRFAYGGAQELYGVTPDVCTLGKLIGGGFPLAAVAGSADIMKHFDGRKVPSKDFLMQVGTLSGNPVAAVAGLKTLEIMRRKGAYEKLHMIGRKLMEAFTEHLSRAGIAHRISGHETLFDVVFTGSDVNDYRDMASENESARTRFNTLLRKKGIFKAPAKLYVSAALDEQDIEQTEQAVAYAAGKLS